MNTPARGERLGAAAEEEEAVGSGRKRGPPRMTAENVLNSGLCQIAADLKISYSGAIAGYSGLFVKATI